jgi:hypothetical protein
MKSSRWHDGCVACETMRRLAPAYAALALFSTPTHVTANEEACHNLGRAEMIFVGRVKSAPITRRISGDEQIDKARVVMEAAERELKAFEALKIPPEIGFEQHRDLSMRMVKAREAFDHTRAMYPPPMDLSLTPILVEVPLRGVTTADVFLQGPELEPARSYLFYAGRPLGRIAADVISLMARPKEVEAAEADLRFLNEAIAQNPGTVVSGSVTMENPWDTQSATPLAGVLLRVSLDDQQMETSTRSDGTFMLTGVPPGRLSIEPVLPEHLTLAPNSVGGQSKGGCLALHMRVKFNGRIRGRVLLDDGTPFRGFVDLISDDPRQRRSSIAPKLTNDRGEFMFTALSPGPYLVGVNIARQPSSGAPFRPTYFPGTTDRSQATPVLVEVGAVRPDVEWSVSSRLGEGGIEVSFDTRSQPQKEMGVCVTMFDADGRSDGGAGYERRSAEPVIVRVVEGVRYRLIAWARTSSGFAESQIFDVIGAPGHRAITLQMRSVSERAPGIRCAASHSDEPFSP